VSRYDRQSLLPQVGEGGQAKLAAARILLVGCGALGTNIAEQLIRAGVGFLRIVDRDIVEWTNLQRQVLFDESHAQSAWPKALAAAERLRAINSQVVVEPHVADVHSANIESLCESISLILDGTDNVSSRYLLNDVSVKLRIPWIYGACIGTEGRMMLVQPGASPCLRCVFPDPPRPQDLPTCDTAGVLGAAAAVVASLQAVSAIKWLTSDSASIRSELTTIDVWENRFHSMSLSDAKRADCVCCGSRQFEYLSAPPDQSAVTLCGRDAIQIRGQGRADLQAIASRWKPLGSIEANRFFVRCNLHDDRAMRLTLFADGRLIVHGTTDPVRAKSLYARYVGS
jgi:molybdopterin/thiamine biosynthesis adenylyltransferase